MKAVLKVKFLQLETDDKLNLSHYINNNCKSTSNQFNTLIRLKQLSRFEERKVLVNTFDVPYFNYCSLVWNFSSLQSLNKFKNLQKKALRFLLDDYDSTSEDLLEKSGYPNMNLRRQRTLCLEIYKLNPGYMNDIFILRNKNTLLVKNMSLTWKFKTQSSRFWNMKP